MWLLVGAFGVALAGGGALVWHARHYHPTPKQPVDSSGRRLRVLFFQQAQSHMREARWREARASLLQLRKLSPDYPGVQDHLDRVEQETLNESLLKAARTALTEKKLAVARAELEKITPDTMMFEQVGALKRALREAEAAEAAEQLQAENGVSCELPVPTAPPAPVDPWQQVVSRFERQDLRGATALARACASRNPRCKSGLKELEELNTLAGRLDTLKDQELLRLLTLDQRLTENAGPSPLFSRAGSRAVGLFYKSALAAKAKGQWQQAARDARWVLQVDPSHAGATSLLAAQKTEAKEHFLRGYALKEAEPTEARKHFQQVMALTLPDDEQHQKAQAWLRKLQ